MRLSYENEGATYEDHDTEEEEEESKGDER